MEFVPYVTCLGSTLDFLLLVLGWKWGQCTVAAVTDQGLIILDRSYGLTSCWLLHIVGWVPLSYVAGHCLYIQFLIPNGPPSDSWKKDPVNKLLPVPGTPLLATSFGHFLSLSPGCSA